MMRRQPNRTCNRDCDASNVHRGTRRHVRTVMDYPIAVCISVPDTLVASVFQAVKCIVDTIPVRAFDPQQPRPARADAVGQIDMIAGFRGEGNDVEILVEWRGHDRALRANNYTFKKSQRTKVSSDLNKDHMFYDSMNELYGEDTISVDASHFNAVDSVRYGWGKRGSRVHKKGPRSGTVSLCSWPFTGRWRRGVQDRVWISEIKYIL